jgi:hypothetical protein
MGHFDQARLSDYLQLLSSGTETYRIQNLFHFARRSLGGLPCSTAASLRSQHGFEPMHGIIDRSYNSSAGQLC